MLNIWIMGLFSFGSRSKPKPFGFIPRYYDKDKEDLEARLSKYNKDIDTAELMKSRIRTGFLLKSGGDRAAHKAASRKSNFRLIMIIATLVLIVIYILQSETVMKMIAVFTRSELE